MPNPQIVEATETYTYSPISRGLRDWLRVQARLVDLVGQRIFATVLPHGCPMPAVDFHRMPGGTVDWSLEHAHFQFNCWASNPGSDSAKGGPEFAEQVAATLASVFMSTPPKTRLAPGVLLEGAAYEDTFYVPEMKSGLPRQVLLMRLSINGA